MSLSSIRYDQAACRRAYRERIRERDSEIVIPAITDLAGRKKIKTQIDANPAELLQYCADVDKDINIYDRALWDVCKAICERMNDEEVPTVAEITALRDSYFDDAYAAMPMHLRPMQIAPALDEEDQEPAFKDEDNAKQLNVLDEIAQVVEEKAKLAPILRKCEVCKASVQSAIESPLNASVKIITFMCGSILQVTELSDGIEPLQLTRGCPYITEPVLLIEVVKAKRFCECCGAGGAFGNASGKLVYIFSCGASVEYLVEYNEAGDATFDDLPTIVIRCPIEVEIANDPDFKDDPDPDFQGGPDLDISPDLLEEAAEMFGSSLPAVVAACAKSEAAATLDRMDKIVDGMEAIKEAGTKKTRTRKAK